MAVKILSSTPWIKSRATGRHYRTVEIDRCPSCRKRNVTAVHHVGERTANCNRCYVPFECPPPSRRSELH